MKYQDIQLSDVSLQSQFANAWLSGNYSYALQMLSNNPQLNSKAFMASVMQNIGTYLSALESYYFTDFEDVLDIQLDIFNNAVNQFRQRNQWVETETYVVGNFVVYQNAVYLCIEANINQLPTNETYWAYVGLIGETGADGIAGELKYQWSSVVSYYVGDVIVYGDAMWYATQNSNGQVPQANSEYWEVFLDFPVVKIIISRTEPTSPYEGLVWFRILLAYTWAEVNALNYTFQDINNLGKDWKWINGGGW